MAIKRLEVSNPEYGNKNTTLLTVHSSHIRRRQDVSVYHQVTQATDLPVVILLHGVYGSNWVWMELGGVHKVYEQLRLQGLPEFVLVMPSDGGLWDGSAYLPLTGKNEGNGDYEQWIVDDVKTAVNENISGVTERSNWYISGLSMGGYGALRLGAKFPYLFSGISAHSSVTNLEDLQQFIDNNIDDYVCADVDEVNILHWMKKHQEKLPPLRMDCGTDDSLYQSNLALVSALSELGITSNFEAYPGGHEWPYWHQHVATTLKFFAEIEQNLPKD